MTQYALDMALPVAYSLEQFMVSEANALAHGFVTGWPNWPAHALYLQGEQGSGKTHLAHLWQQKTGAVFLTHNETTLPDKAVIVENIEGWNNETALFHLYNHTKLGNIPLLITSSLLPDALTFNLPDLRSRLNALPLAILTPPDDALLTALLAKQLADRQLKISQEVIHYMLPRLPRSYSDIVKLVETLDTSSLEAGRTITIPYVRQVCGW